MIKLTSVQFGYAVGLLQNESKCLVYPDPFQLELYVDCWIAEWNIKLFRIF